MMYGLIMLREYLDEILDGAKFYDARAYNTNKRGLIALVDTREFAIIGTVELIGTKPIKIKKAGRVWTKLDDSIEKELYDFVANSLFGGERE